MSSKVPNEILIEIFQQLHPIDQLECMLVCHRWNQIIEDSVLYRTVFIYSSEDLKKLLQKIQQRPDIANRIEKLVLWIRHEDEAYPSSKLLSLIPNLKVLSHCTPTVLRNKTQYPWYNQIEYISEDTEEEAAHVPLSDTYPNLKTFSYRYNDWTEYFPFLKNASALTSLTLEEVSMGFDDLEVIHRNAPHLKSLKFRPLYYGGESLFSGREITPATSVTEFVAHVNCDVDDGENFSHPELHVDLLLYVSRKYPNLSTLEYIYCGDGGLEYHEVIVTGLNPLLQRLGPQLKKVYISLSDEADEADDLIDQFDEFDCQINYLNIHCWYNDNLYKLAQSTQAFYIQTLIIRTKITFVYWLKNLRVLKKLELTDLIANYPLRIIQLSDIIDNSPSTLESLSLHTRSLGINPTYTGTSNIKTLIFRSMTFNDKVDRFISQCFPQLLELELKKCELHNNRLNLEKTDLARFSYCNDFKRDLLITTLKDNKRRSYVLRNTKHLSEEVFYPQNYRPFKTYPASDTNDIVSGLNFTCNSVRNVILPNSY